MGNDQSGNNRIKIGFRADGNKEIASGHLMRCLTIADAFLQDGHADVIFFVADEEGAQMLYQRAPEKLQGAIRCLNSRYDDPDTELSLLLPMLREERIDVLFVDSYFVTKEYLFALQRAVKLVYLDDLCNMEYPVDGIINYDIRWDDQCYRQVKEKMLGLSYTPIRKMFCERDYQVKDKIQKLLITAGASYGQMAAEILLPLLAKQNTEGMEIHVLAPGADSAYGALQDMAGKNRTIVLHDYVTDMAAFLEQFDLVLSAAGTTLYELCAMGIPTISFSLADNQITPAEDFEKLELIPYMGDLRSADIALEQCFKSMTDVKFRRQKSEQMKQTIDGKGPYRIVKGTYRL